MRTYICVEPTLCNASFVSICTIVTKLSFACCKYSVEVWFPNFSIGNGEPKPRWPVGGNLAAWTSFFASSAVYRSGTIIPSAKISKSACLLSAKQLGDRMLSGCRNETKRAFLLPKYILRLKPGFQLWRRRSELYIRARGLLSSLETWAFSMLETGQITHRRNLVHLGQTHMSASFDQAHEWSDLRLTIQPSLAANLTSGLTPQAAMAATASCIALSTRAGRALESAPPFLHTPAWPSLSNRQCFHAQCQPVPNRTHSALLSWLGYSLATSAMHRRWDPSLSWGL